MKKNSSIFVIVALVISLIVATKSFLCNPEPKPEPKPLLPDKVIVDSNAKYYRFIERHAEEKAWLYDSIALLNKNLDKAKKAYRFLPGTIITDTITDIECCLEIDHANGVITRQDSIDKFKNRVIVILNDEIKDLNNQVIFNKKNAEDAAKNEVELIEKSFKHIVWRLYWKKQ